jgi:hypothetical protein
MDKTKTTNQNKSALEKFQLFFEHTNDSRVVVNSQAKQLKQPRRNIASKR